MKQHYLSVYLDKKQIIKSFLGSVDASYSLDYCFQIVVVAFAAYKCYMAGGEHNYIGFGFGYGNQDVGTLVEGSNMVKK